jgi:hypothetical protein
MFDVDVEVQRVAPQHHPWNTFGDAVRAPSAPAVKRVQKLLYMLLYVTGCLALLAVSAQLQWDGYPPVIGLMATK